MSAPAGTGSEVAPPTPVDWQPGGAPERPRWVLPASIGGAIGLIALVLVLIVAGSDGEVLGSPTTTTEVRIQRPRLLSEYCDLPGEAWSEVPAYEAGEPIRSHVRFMGGGIDNALDSRTGSDAPWVEPVTLGSTALSPDTDGRFSKAVADRDDVRTVTCVTHTEVVPVGPSCFFRADPTDPRAGWKGYRLSRNAYRVAVFELHTGEILHEGTIETRARSCPRYMSTASFSREIAWGIRPDDVLAWFDENFDEGEPG